MKSTLSIAKSILWYAALATLGVRGVVATAWALPPESVLPQRPSPVGKALPAESSLPNAKQQTGTTQAALPPENALPVKLVNQPQQAMAELQNSRDDRLRLRLAVPEHTSSVFAVAFDPSSGHLFTGGDDKLVHHWRLSAQLDAGKNQWLHEESIRWQVGSGPSGRIRALACLDNTLYLAGYGAEGTRGEIWRYDWVRRIWLTPWVIHNRPIIRLWTFPGKVVSLDEYGGLVLHAADDSVPQSWVREPLKSLPDYYAVGVRPTNRGVEWLADSGVRPWTIQSTEFQGAGQPTKVRSIAPVVPVGSETKVFNDFRIERNLKSLTSDAIEFLKSQRGPDLVHVALSADGRMLAAVDSELKEDVKDLHGHWLYIWRDGTLVVKTRSPSGVQFRHLAWSADSQQLAVLKFSVQGGKPLSRVDLWNCVGQPVREELENQFSNEYYYCQFSPDQSWLALGGRVAVNVIPLKKKPSPQIRLPLQLGVLPLSNVVFSKTGYQWKAEYATNSVTFDPERMALIDLPQDSWQKPLDPATGWQSGNHRISLEGKKWVVKRGNVVLGALDAIREDAPYRVNSAQWIGGSDQGPTHVAIVYEKERENEIHIFSLTEPFQGQLRRVGILNGHEGPVLSMSTAADQRIMISCGVDRQVLTWPIRSLVADENSKQVSWQRYGALFELNAGALVVSQVHPAGPLYEFGLRAGDQITKLNWFKPSADGRTVEEQDVPLNEGVDFLNRSDFETIVKFTYTRQAGPPTSRQLRPQWRALYGLAFDSQREWAAWTAAGFYAASFNGNTSFGWQINRGVDKPPSFYRADRFQAVLERPELLRRVIELGSVEAAAQAVGEKLTSHFNPLENAIALQPTVTILTPRADLDVEGDKLSVEAEIQVPKGTALASVKAFANGVPATLASQKQLPSSADSDRYSVSWSAGLPSDRDIKLQVLAANQHRLVGAADMIVHRRKARTHDSLPRMWIFAGAVGQYEDSLVPSLTTPEKNVQAFTRQIELASKDIYDVQMPIILTGPQMTRSQWVAVIGDQLESLKSIVKPDDVVMIFLSGHGIQDEENGSYYFIPVDASYRDVRAGHYERCLGVHEIAPFSGMPCQKMVILDTCHSGAFQPLESDRLRSAVRVLQADLVLTLTASEGDQKAAEDPNKSNSVFTEVVVKLLEQPVDSDGDKLLTLPEFVKQVQDGVFKKASELQKSSALSQKPKFIPSELLPFVRIPMARTSPVSP